MNEKLIVRAAHKYRDWVVSQKPTPISQRMIRSHLESLSQKSSEVHRWANNIMIGMRQRVQVNTWEPNVRHIGIRDRSIYERIASKMIADVGGDVIDCTKSIVAALKHMTSRNDIFTISPMRAIEEIRAINGAWDEVKFRQNTLRVRINDVSLRNGRETVELGDFWIHLDFANLPEGLTIDSITNIKSPDGFSHPHVKECVLCTGEGTDMNQGNPMGEALAEGRLEDYFRIVEAILRTYNGKSPHEHLEMWYNPSLIDMFLCGSCGEWTDGERGAVCHACDTGMCEDCSGSGCCVACNNDYCSKCLTICTECSETTCEECSLCCDICNGIHCRRCLRNTCVSCDNRYCPECGQSCDQCGRNVCDKCKLPCNCCGDGYCRECLGETCDLCEGLTCDHCMNTCSACNRKVCESCASKECKHCGVPMCNHCHIEHECLLSPR